MPAHSHSSPPGAQHLLLNLWLLCVCISPLQANSNELVTGAGSRLEESAIEVTTTRSVLVELGRELFFDPNLSANRSQACASCHDAMRAFSDPGINITSGAVSIGANGHSLGDRNTPPLTYAALIPPWQRAADGQYIGGLFLDGRSLTLMDQVEDPLTNPIEMAQPDFHHVAARVSENPDYRLRLQSLFGAAVMNDTAQLIQAIKIAIVAFERSAELSSFDSRYDRYLRGEYTMTREETLGRDLFFSQLTNCTSCHLSNEQQISDRETFTSYRYHNIGIPVNVAVRKANRSEPGYVDVGLLANPRVNDPSLAGKFRVPTLRNVAVSGPYMHNGVFSDLHTAVLFYGKYTLSNASSQLNPETQSRWGDAEVPQTIDLDLLREGQPIDATRTRHLVAFLKTLTDKRYEHLLE